MNNLLLSLVTWSLIGTSALYAEAVNLAATDLQAVGVVVATQSAQEQFAIQVIKDAAIKEFDEPTFAKMKNVRFHNGVIELKVLSKLRPDAPDFARGFIGVAFRINEDDSKFECLYLRPQNARADSQLRRNRSTQYFSFPDFKFERLRKEAPGEYESYADMGLNEWISIRIEVNDAKAKLFVNGQKQPALVVNDLKHGAGTAGAIGLWVDVGTEGYFSDIKIHTAE